MVAEFQAVTTALVLAYAALFLISLRCFRFARCWFSYALLGVAFNVAWLFGPRDLWMTILGSVARCVITAEAISLLFARAPFQRLWWAVSVGAGIGAGAVLYLGGLTWLGRLRTGELIALAGSVALCVSLWNRHRVGAGAMVHGSLLTVWSASSAVASALHSKRGDAVDVAAMLVQCATLLGWIWAQKFFNPRVEEAQLGLDVDDRFSLEPPRDAMNSQQSSQRSDEHSRPE